MSEVLVVGPDDHGLADRLAAAGVDAHRLDGRPVGADLEGGGIAGAGVFIVTDAGLASLISVAKEHNPDVVVVLYGGGGLPDFAARQADLAIDPRLVDPDEVVDAVVDRLATTT